MCNHTVTNPETKKRSSSETDIIMSRYVTRSITKNALIKRSTQRAKLNPSVRTMSFVEEANSLAPALSQPLLLSAKSAGAAHEVLHGEHVHVEESVHIFSSYLFCEFCELCFSKSRIVWLGSRMFASLVWSA
jgi:hypothetical protein